MDERNEQQVQGEGGPMGHVVVVPFGRRRATADAATVHSAEVEDATSGVSAESRLRHPSAGGRPSLRIDCGECAMEGTDACADCVMSFVVSREPGDALVVDAEEARAQRILAEAGLLPTLRHRRRASGD